MWLSTGRAADPEGSATRAKLGLLVLDAGRTHRRGTRGVSVGGSALDLGKAAIMEVQHRQRVLSLGRKQSSNLIVFLKKGRIKLQRVSVLLMLALKIKQCSLSQNMKF